jgi:N-acetylglucosaminyl-diphospho-decaprenol L-rhamnosyltransferase
MPNAPLLSVIIVGYKSSEEIGPCLASIPRRLGGRDVAGEVEVIVVDNSPGDGADEIVRRDFPWVRYVAAPENLGFGRANNLGFGQSMGEYVLFLNPDTVCNAHALEYCVRRLRTEANVGLISPKLVLADGSMDAACRRSIPTLWDGFCRATGLAAAFPRAKLLAGYNLTHLPVDGTYDVGAINGAFMMARREVLERVAENPLAREKSVVGIGDSGPASVRPAAIVFDENFFMYGDDLDLCIRVARAGYRIVYDGRVAITHLKGVSVGKDYDQMAKAIFDANREVYLKHFNPRGSRFVRWKYQLAFGTWKRFARLRAKLAGSRQVKPL